MITKQEVKHIANLSRLGLSEKEIKKYQRDLSSVLAYVEKLKEVDIRGIEPTSHSVLMENVTRKDEAAQGKKRLIGGYLKVKSIFND